MNLFQLVAKQMRQRALSSWLTLASVTLGVALAIALLVTQREAGQLFGQTQYGYDLVVGAKGSKLQLVLNTVYGLDQPPGTVPWEVYESLLPGGRYGGDVTWAVPVAVTDQVKGHPIVATLPSILGVADDGRTPLPEEKVFPISHRQAAWNWPKASRSRRTSSRRFWVQPDRQGRRP